MNSYKKLFKNSIVFAIGRLGSRLISLLLVPLYTHYLTTVEYGTVDIIIVTVTMLLPVVSFSMYDAVMRFAMDRDMNQSSVFTTAILVSLVGVVISILVYPVLLYLNVFGDYLIFMYLLLIVQIFEIILSQYTRGIGKSKVFAINGILLTFNTGILNIIFLVVFTWGITGYLLSSILANIISIIYLNLNSKLYNVFDLSSINSKLSKSLLKYSLPLIPNSIMWSLINAASRYFILYFLGLSANGLFAIASKVPLVINVISQIFSQAWQLSAIEENEKKSTDISKFYTNTFLYLSTIMFMGVSIVTLFVKVLFQYLFSVEYYNAWQVTPFLLMGAVFSSFSNFLGAVYIANKKTQGVFKTSLFGGGTSLIINALLIPVIGIVGAGISSTLSFFVMFLLRLRDTQRYTNMAINWKIFISNLMIILIQIVVLFLNLPTPHEISINFFLLIMLLVINKHLFNIVYIIIERFKKR